MHSAVIANPDVHEGILVTTGTFTGGAKTYAHQVGLIQLIDYVKLSELTAQADIPPPNH